MYFPVFMNQQNNQAVQYLTVPHPSMANMMHIAPNPQLATAAKLGPVERAVLTQVLGDSRPHKRKAQLRCETCSVSFNSQGQADTHYRGKRHARITEIRRRKSQKPSDPAKLDSDGNQTTTDQSAFSESDNNQPVQQGAEMTDTVAGNIVLSNGTGVEPKEPKSETSVIAAGVPTPTSEPNENATTLDSTIQKYCAAEQLNDKLEIREETEEEKQARLEMEAEVKKMLENLPPFVKRVVRTVKPLDENMHCKDCDVWVNSDTQMKQHLGSLRHKNTIAGIPVPPRPDKVEPAKPRSNHQYKCELCNVTLNSEVQLLQHLRSQRHKATLEGKPPKPRWVPYERFREQQRLQAKLKIQAASYANAAYQPFIIPQMAPMAQLPQLQGVPPGMQFVQLM